MCMYCWCQTPEGVVSPRRATTRATIFSTATHILLIKRNLKFESRATAVSIAMSPSITVAPPRSRKCACQFLQETERVKSNCARTGVICFPWRHRSWSCGVFKSWISDAHCPFQWKWQVLRDYDISVLQQVGMFFRWDILLDEILAFVQAGASACPDDVTFRSCTNFKCDIADVNK